MQLLFVHTQKEKEKQIQQGTLLRLPTFFYLHKLPLLIGPAYTDAKKKLYFTRHRFRNKVLHSGRE